jgi:hypothetical protein
MRTQLLVLRLPVMPDVPAAIETEAVRYDGGSGSLDPCRRYFSVTIELLQQNVNLV